MSHTTIHDRASTSGDKPSVALHSRFVHAFLRLHISAVMLLFVGVIVAVGYIGQPEHAFRLALALLPGVLLWYVFTGRYWVVHLSSSEIVARRFTQMRRIPLRIVQAVERPKYVHPLLGFYWDERRIVMHGERPIHFICSGAGYRRLKAILPIMP